MARRRSYSTEAVVEAAKETFWRLGYQGAAISDLEAATGLSRSSLYQAFGSKRELFAQALDAYIRGFIGPLLAPMEAPAADDGCVERFVRRLAELVREGGPAGRYGCLWVNSIVERGRPDPGIDVRAGEYWARVQHAYDNGLRCAAPRDRDGVGDIEQHAAVLASATFGWWIAVRSDTLRALALADAMLGEITSWQRPGS